MQVFSYFKFMYFISIGNEYKKSVKYTEYSIPNIHGDPF